MSFVRIEQRNAHLASDVKLERLKTPEGLVSKAIVVVISNIRRGQGREDKVTSIQWTLWVVQADNASENACIALHDALRHRTELKHGNRVFHGKPRRKKAAARGLNRDTSFSRASRNASIVNKAG